MLRFFTTLIFFFFANALAASAVEHLSGTSFGNFTTFAAILASASAAIYLISKIKKNHATNDKKSLIIASIIVNSIYFLSFIAFFYITEYLTIADLAAITSNIPEIFIIGLLILVFLFYYFIAELILRVFGRI